jgi:PST family polysaccharide transporter
LGQAAGGRVINFASQIVLARILAPEHFGLLGLAMTVITIVGALTSFGVDEVLLQRQKSMHQWVGAGFRVSLALSLAAFAIVCVATPIAAHAYRSPDLNVLMPILALSLPMTALSTIPSVILRSQMQFGTLARLAIVEQLAQQGLTIALALAGFGALSFVIPVPLAVGARAAILWFYAKPRLKKVRRSQYLRMLQKGGAVFGVRLVYSSIHQGDYAILGLLTSPAVVGVYFFAYRLAVQPIYILAGSFQQVLFPALAQLTHDPARLRAAALDSSKVLACAVMPYCFVQAAVAEPALNLVFGEKWNGAVLLIQLLSIGLAFDAVSWLAGALLNARGEFGAALRYALILAPIFLLAVALGALWGAAIGVAVAVALYYGICQPIYSYVIFRRLGVSLKETLAIYLLPFGVAAAATAGTVAAADLAHFGDLTRLALVPPVAGVLYLLLLRLCAPALSERLTGRLRDIIQSRRAAAGA